MPRPERVLVDTATRYPISLADLVLRLAEYGIYDLVWSAHLLGEVERVLVEYKGLRAEAGPIMGAALREPLTRAEVLDRLAAAGTPVFAARAAELG